MIGYEVTETVTAYLNSLLDEVTSPQYKEEFISYIAEEFAQTVDEIIPRWNPNLTYSGLNPENWKILHEQGISELEIIYSGFKGRNLKSKGTWYEFGKKHKGGVNDPLGRDYAYYQEYGIDKYVKAGYHKAKTFEGHHYLEGTVEAFDETVMESYAGEYLRQIMPELK